MDKREKKSLLVWTVWCKEYICAGAHNGVRLPELVLWHSTLSDMVGRPLSRVLCVIIEGVIIWADEHRATDTLPSCMWQPHDIGRMLVRAMKLK